MDEKIFFKIKLNIPELDEYHPVKSEKVTFEYEAELILNWPEELFIKIFFKEEEMLDDKFSRWSHEYEHNILNKITVTDIITPQDLILVDFCNYSYKGMTVASNFYEYDHKYFTIKLRGIKLGYQNREKDDSKFYLNGTSLKLIELNYFYKTPSPWSEDNYKWEPKNRQEEFCEFDRISFLPEHHFYVKNKSTNEEVSIHKEPRLRVKHQNLTEQEIKQYGQLICNLYSFYSQQSIEYSVSKIYAEDKFFYEVRDVSNRSINDPHGIFRWDFRQNPINLISNVNPHHLFVNYGFVSNLIDRFNYALEIQGESKFMILYNILEQLRNEYIKMGLIEKVKAGSPPNPKKVIDKYQFIYGKDKTDKEIKTILEMITNIIVDEDKELFQKELHHKVSQLKLISMASQFDSLFTFIDINPDDFDLNFKDIKSLRDLIFHGHSTEGKIDYLERINRYNRLPRLVGMSLLKYFGIDDFSTLKFVKQE